MSFSGNARSRIVVRGTNWVGDTVMTIPALRELRTLFPDAWIALWVKKGLADLAAGIGVADQIITFGPELGGAPVRPFRMARILAAGEFHLAVLLQNAFESAFTARLAGIPLRAGYPTDMRGPLLNIRIPLTRQVRTAHQVYYYLGITDGLKHSLDLPRQPAPAEPDCSLNLDESRLSRAETLLGEAGGDLRRPIFCLCPGSVNSEAKRWPPDYFATLADMMHAEMGGQIVFLGTPEERGLIETIKAGMAGPHALNLAGRAGMMDSIAVMARSGMVISNDTGSAHLAVAASAVVLTIFGPTIAHATAPFGPTAHTIQRTVPCAPCRHYRCPVEGHPCMRNVEPEEVARTVRRILRERDGVRTAVPHRAAAE